MQLSINAAAGADRTIISANAGDKLAIFDYVFTAAAGVGGTFIVKDAAGNEYGRYVIGTAGGTVVVSPLGDGTPRFFSIGSLIVNVSGIAITGHVTFAAMK